jgi:transcription elongation factor GreA
MPPKRNSNSINQEISLGETANQFLSTVSSTQATIQQEIFKFIRWFGEERAVSSITGQEIVNYSDQINFSTNTSNDHLTAVKQFLLYAHKKALTPSNLAPLVRIKKITVKSSISSSSRAKADEAIMLTSQGFEEMKAKLAKLKEERPKIAEELNRAAADKDFRENAPLEAAREKQGHVEGQIRQLEDTMKRAKIVEAVSDDVLRVMIGDCVTISEIESGEEIIYTLVSSREADIKHGKISSASPMGQSLFNKETGELLEVIAPSGVIKYKILKITRG